MARLWKVRVPPKAVFPLGAKRQTPSSPRSAPAPHRSLAWHPTPDRALGQLDLRAPATRSARLSCPGRRPRRRNEQARPPAAVEEPQPQPGLALPRRRRDPPPAKRLAGGRRRDRQPQPDPRPDRAPRHRARASCSRHRPRPKRPCRHWRLRHGLRSRLRRHGHRRILCGLISRGTGPVGPRPARARRVTRSSGRARSRRRGCRRCRARGGTRRRAGRRR